MSSWNFNVAALKQQAANEPNEPIMPTITGGHCVKLCGVCVFVRACACICVCACVYICVYMCMWLQFKNVAQPSLPLYFLVLQYVYRKHVWLYMHLRTCMQNDAGNEFPGQGPWRCTAQAWHLAVIHV